MIDTHCHIFKEYYSNIDDIINKSSQNGVDKMIVNGTNLENNKEILKLAEKYDSIYIALGFQPEDIDNNTRDNYSIITDNIDKIVAIGEIGLDYYNGPQDKEKQKKIFEEQLALAEKYNKPVIIHTRNAHRDTIASLNKYPNVKGIIHCFSEGLNEAKEYISLGFYLGIGGIVTFKNSELSKVLEHIDLSHIVLETDSPYLAPVPLRGKVNEPSNLIYIAQKISEIKGISADEVSKITTNNANQIFDF